jgi:hypothetical protein
MINYGATICKNPNVIPNGALIGGVANFYTNTKPTTRVDGSALVIGDLWYSPNTGSQGFWNGTYWLTTTEDQIKFSNVPFPAGGGVPSMDDVYFGDKGMFLTDLFIIFAWTAGLSDAANKATTAISINRWSGGAAISPYILDTFDLSPAAIGRKATKKTVNTALTVPGFIAGENTGSSGSNLRFVTQVTTGTPGTYTVSGSLFYRNIL